MKIRATFLMLAGLSIATASAFASDYCVKDISLDTYKSFIPQPKPRAQRYSNEPLKQDLPSFSVSATLDNHQLSFVKQDGQTYPVTKLNSGDDYNGWDAIYELEDHWLYIGGVQYNHVLHFHLNSQQQWVVDQIIRIKKEEGIVERLASFVFGWDTVQIRRDNLTSIKRISGDVVYSPVLQRLFIPTAMQEFKNGDFTPFGNVKAKTTYVGDIPRLKIAFLKADNGQLYSYDGVQLKPVINGRVKPFLLDKDVFETGVLHDVPALNRLFYTIRAGVYELVKKPDTYELKPIPLPENAGNFWSNRFIPTPDGNDIAIFTRGNITMLNSLEGIYPRSVPKQQINTTGSYALPALIPQLKGIVFTTGGLSYPMEHHLLTKCSDK